MSSNSTVPNDESESNEVKVKITEWLRAAARFLKAASEFLRTVTGLF